MKKTKKQRAKKSRKRRANEGRTRRAGRSGRPGEPRTIGEGPYCCSRIPWMAPSAGVIFRFETHAEALAANRKSIELDHIIGCPSEVKEAILAAARAARLGAQN
jgi:hypothetical protein